MSSQFGNHSPLPPNADLAAMLRAGTTLADLAKRYGVRPATISGHLGTAGWAPDGNPAGETARRARLPVFHAPEWMDRALCAQVDPEIFFPDQGGMVDVRNAKKVCRVCPVRTLCLEHALTYDEGYGIWGGTTEHERRRLTRLCKDCGAPREPQRNYCDPCRDRRHRGAQARYNVARAQKRRAS